MNEETEQKQEDEPLEMNLLEKGSQKPVSKTDEVPKTTESEPLENTPKTTEDEPVESNPSENDSKEVKGILEDTKGAGRFLGLMFGIMIFSLILAFLWDKVPIIKDSVHAILNPTAGVLIAWNLDWGFLILIFIISLLTTAVQKYATDQESIKKLKAEQKEMQKEVQKFKHDPKKMMEMNKASMPLMLKIMQLSMKATIFTIVPFILLFRWFLDIFTTMGEPRFFGFFTWFWFYLIFVMVFSTILRKWMKVA